MKKFIALASAVVLATVSCGAKPENTPDVKLREPEFTEEGLPVITVGTYGAVDPLLKDSLNKPNDMEVRIIDFKDGVESGMTSAEELEIQRKNIDRAVITGELPDIIFLTPDDVIKYNKQGVLTDLFALMDEYDGIKREDFTDCALEGLTVDGRFPAIMENYNICTLAAKTRFVPKEYENWTAADAMRFYGELPDEMAFGEFYKETDFADMMLRVEGMSCIDMSTGKCDFSGSFAQLLDFCDKNHPQLERDYDSVDLTDDEIYFLMKDNEVRGKNDVQLVYPMRINGFDSGLAQNTYGYFGGEDITFVGYPSEDGCGAVVEPAINSMTFMCITEQSPNKELAWELVNRMIRHRDKLEKNMNTDIRGISVFKSELQKDYDRPDDYSNSINRTWTDLSGREEYKLPQEYKEMLWEYIMSVPVDPYKPDELRYMVDEECHPVILDRRTADEAAKILQNRIETYLSENS